MAWQIRTNAQGQRYLYDPDSGLTHGPAPVPNESALTRHARGHVTPAPPASVPQASSSNPAAPQILPPVVPVPPARPDAVHDLLEEEFIAGTGIKTKYVLAAGAFIFAVMALKGGRR